MLDARRGNRIREMPHVPRNQIVCSVQGRDGRVSSIGGGLGRKRMRCDEGPAQRDGIIADTDHLDRIQRGETGAGRFRVADARLFDHEGRHDQFEPPSPPRATTPRVATWFPRVTTSREGHAVR